MALSTSTGLAEGVYLNDCYGTLTQAFGTPITRVIPPVAGARSCVGNFCYEAAGTAHTLTMMPAVAEVAAASEAASGQAVLSIGAGATAPDGSAIAASDWFIVQHEDGSWGEYRVSSTSGLAITFASNLTAKVLKGARVFFMGAPSAADHPLRRFTMKASTTTTFTAGDLRIRACTSATPDSPILVYSDNATAAGTLYWLSYYFD